jgi:hypothetical protein
MLDPPVNSSDGFSRCFVLVGEQSKQAGIVSSTIAADQLLDEDPYQVRILG